MAILCGIMVIIINGALLLSHIRKGNWSLIPAYIPWVMFGIVIVLARGDLYGLWKRKESPNEDRRYMNKVPSRHRLQHQRLNESPTDPRLHPLNRTEIELGNVMMEEDTPDDFVQISLNPGAEPTMKNPLCPVCEQPIVPVSNHVERRFICDCDDLREFTFEEDHERIATVDYLTE